MAFALAQQFGPKEHGFVGLGTGEQAFILAVGIPTVAAQLAVANGSDFSLQYGTLVDPDVRLPDTLGDPDLLEWSCAARLSVERCLDVFRRGMMTCSFISGAQVDKFGNLNSVQIGRDRPPAVRLTGPIAQSDHSVYAQRTFIVLPHDRRVFVDRVDFISGVGYGEGADWRRKQGLPGGGPAKVITTKAVLGFEDDTKRMRLETVHPGVTIDDVVDSTGFELIVPDDVPTTAGPSDDQLLMIRERIDVGGKLLSGGIR
ncbi:CoA-transferase [Microbacterium sp. BWT-B31]|uniref:CoA-transferase n=1 Tax=Microbacterium sp. BWT-B31 TaxID=3232072 RepID=UPI00352898BD